MTPGSTPAPGDGPERRWPLGLGPAWRADRAGLRSATAVLVAGIAGLLVAAVLALLARDGTGDHVSRATLLLDQPRAVAGAGDDQLVVKLSRLRVKYRDLATADAVVDPVAARLGIEPAEVRRRQFVGLPDFALSVVAGARAPDPADAEALAQALAERLSAYAGEEQEAAGVPPEQRVELRLISGASAAEEIEPSGSRARTVATLGGLLTALFVWAGIQLAGAARSLPAASIGTGDRGT